MSEGLVLSLQHVTSGYHEGGLFRKGNYQEVLFQKFLHLSEEFLKSLVLHHLIFLSRL